MPSFVSRARGWFARRDLRPATPAAADRLTQDELHAEVTSLLARVLGVAAPALEIPATVTPARIAAWLTEHDFNYFVDNDGDLGGLWHGRLFYFFLFGDQSEILQVRGQWQREVAIERMAEILDICNEWNTERIWPKAYVRVRDNGRVHVVAEVSLDLEHGATDAQLHQTLQCGLSTGNLFFDALDERYPDPVGVAP